jgi:hypothetical protein
MKTVLATILIGSALGFVSPATAATAKDADPTSEDTVTSSDRTAALSTPTPLVTPAVALAPGAARVLLGADLQRPGGTLDSIRPEFQGEVGVGHGVTVGAGSRWVGGDAGHAANGLAPWVQARLQLFGNGLEGWSGGVGLAYKQIGFGGGERETEASFSATFRSRWLEAGGQAVFGQSLRDAGEHDLEGRVYGAYRVLPIVSLGLAAQLRAAVGEVEPGANTRRADWLAGAIATAYFGGLQVGVLGGGSSVGLITGVGVVGQGFASYRF